MGEMGVSISKRILHSPGLMIPAGILAWNCLNRRLPSVHVATSESFTFTCTRILSPRLKMSALRRAVSQRARLGGSVKFRVSAAPSPIVDAPHGSRFPQPSAVEKNALPRVVKLTGKSMQSNDFFEGFFGE